MTAPTPLQRLEQALAELGALTPDEIADRMRAAGIKGLRRKVCRCVLAVYLAHTGLEGIRVQPVGGGHDGAWFAQDAPLRRWTYRSQLPESVAEFARRFDAGVYLDLVAVDGGAADA